MNELIFFLHIATVILFVLIGAKLGKGTLISLVGLQAVLANLFVLKQTTLFGLHVTTADVYIIGSLLAMNLLQEHWGKKATKKAVWASFLGLIFFGVVSRFQIAYLPSTFDTTQEAYSRLLHVQPRILIASLIAYFLTQQLDIRLFGRLQKTNWPLPLRSGISLIICQLFDTLLFSTLGLYGLVTSLLSIMVMSFVIKLIIILCMVVPLRKRREV